MLLLRLVQQHPLLLLLRGVTLGRPEDGGQAVGLLRGLESQRQSLEVEDGLVVEGDQPLEVLLTGGGVKVEEGDLGLKECNI